MNGIHYNSGDTVKYRTRSNNTYVGIIRTVNGQIGDRIIRLTSDVYIHESQIIFRFDLRYMN